MLGNFSWFLLSIIYVFFKNFFFQNVLSWIPCQTVKLDAQSNGVLFMTPRCLNCLITSYDQAFGATYDTCLSQLHNEAVYLFYLNI